MRSAGGGVRTEAVAPEALAAWLERWAAEHGGVTSTDVRPGRLTYTAADGARIACDPPFPPLEGVSTGRADAFVTEPLIAHAARERVTGVILAGPRGHAAGVFAGARLVDSAVEGRPAKRSVADLAARVLLAHRDDLEALVLAGQRRALAEAMTDGRLHGLTRLAGEDVIDVADHRLANLRRLPERFRATVIRPA
jgi:hypothetical protein